MRADSGGDGQGRAGGARAVGGARGGAGGRARKRARLAPIAPIAPKARRLGRCAGASGKRSASARPGFAARIRPRVLRALRVLRSERGRRRMARQVLGGVSGAVLGAALLGSAHGAGLGAGAERGVSADGLAAGAAAATRVAGAAGGSADAVGAARVAGMTGAAESPAATAASGVAAPPVAAKAPGPKAAGGGSAAASAAPGGPLRPLPASTPVSLAIPAIGVRAPMMALGLDGAGALETPPFDMPGTAAWFRDSPAPGAVGASVVVGHVDTRSGPAVFWKLAALRTGSTVEVARLDGRVAVFTVQRVRMYPKDRFPAKEVYSASGPADRSELRLITCGGPFDRKRAEYTGNVVAYARLTAVR